MKILAGILLFTTTLHACPELGGTYVRCLSSSGVEYEYETEIIESYTDGFPTYSVTHTYPETGLISKFNFITDGKPHSISYKDPATGRNVTISQTATCKDNVLTTISAVGSGSNHQVVTTATWTMIDSKLVIKYSDNWGDEGKNGYTLTCE